MLVERMGSEVPYNAMFALQESRHFEVREDSERETLFLLQHRSVVTLGKNASREHLRLSDEAYAERSIDLVDTGRGGDVTWHGPGQVVGYPIIKFSEDERDIKRYVWNLEEVMIRTAADYGVTAERVDGLRGIWVGARKLAAIGVRIARWTTLHGFALNVAPDLTNFDLIVPCGIQDRGVTSLRELLADSAPSIRDVEDRLIKHTGEILGRSVHEVQSSTFAEGSTD